MTRGKKLIIGLLVSFIALLLVGYTMLDRAANAYLPKTLIIEKLETLTNNNVTITGELHWHYSLRPSVVIDKVILTSEDKHTITMENIRLKMQLSALFNKPLFFESLHIAQLSYRDKSNQLSVLENINIKNHSSNAENPSEYSGEIYFQQWQQNQLYFSKGHSHLEFKNNVLFLSKFKAEFYQGSIQGNAAIDFNDPAPKIDITLKATQVETSGILAAIAHNAYVSGKMDITAHFSSQGKNSAEFIEHLNGKASVLVKNGELNVIHLDQLIPAFVSSPPKNINAFSILKIDALIMDGVANTTLNLSEKNYRSQGKGNINLIQQTLNLHFDSYYTRSEKTKEIAIPAEVSGPISSPEISVNISQPLNQLLKADGQSLSEKIKKLLGRS